MCMRNNKASSGNSRRISSWPGGRQRLLRAQKALTINKLTDWTALKLRTAWKETMTRNKKATQLKSNLKTTQSRKRYLWYIYIRTKFKIISCYKSVKDNWIITNSNLKKIGSLEKRLSKGH